MRRTQTLPPNTIESGDMKSLRWTGSVALQEEPIRGSGQMATKDQSDEAVWVVRQAGITRPQVSNRLSWAELDLGRARASEKNQLWPGLTGIPSGYQFTWINSWGISVLNLTIFWLAILDRWEFCLKGIWRRIQISETKWPQIMPPVNSRTNAETPVFWF